MLRMNVAQMTLALGITLGLVACEEKSSNKLVLGQQAVQCDLTLETLPGTEWIIEKINPDKSVEPDMSTRLKFYKDGDKIMAKYNVGSLSDMYTYECDVKGDELDCREPPKLKDWCQALIVADGAECTAEKLKEWAPKATDEELAAGMKEANEVVAKYREGPEWQQFMFNNNNLGNKLQGLLYAKINARKCNLTITDMYMTIYNGKRLEDSNPVGTNAFVKNDKGELLWEHCTDSGDLYARKTGDFPEKEEDIQACYPNMGCSFAVNEEVHYHYLGQDGREAKEGCTYSYDLWANGKPLQKDVQAELVDANGKKEVRWHNAHKFDAAGPEVVTMVRYQTCEGKKEQTEVSCNLVNVQ
ncbi:MAG: hypothetical protein H6739_21315 [Alphaproteobacteria bacterium]|nr:hypothetical protein [Alphaproteobacteria bacterium]